MKLKEKYILAKCCAPQRDDAIIGYYSHDNIIKVHSAKCNNIMKTEQDRLVELAWEEIVAAEEFEPGEDFYSLDKIDFAVMNHHKRYGVDYSHKVARVLGVERQQVFEKHKKLRERGLLERVEPRIIQYRKNIVPGKWIKHRNHTYYDLTAKGRRYLDYYEQSDK